MALTLLVFALCGATGVVQSRSLRLAARGKASALAFGLRLLLVGGNLLAAALLGQLAAGALGWALGFAGGCALLWWRWT